MSTWDDGILAHELKDLVELNFDFDLEATGFTMGEIDLLIEGVGDSSDSDGRADALPATAMPMVARPGDIWLLRDHRIIYGDATLTLTYEQLIGAGELPTMIFADPPYNVPIDGHVSELGAIRHREFAMGSGEMFGASWRF